MPDEPRSEPTPERIAAAYRAQRFEEARAGCEARLARRPDDPDALVWLGTIATAERRWRDAIAAYDRAMRIRVDPWSLANMGQCHAKLGELEHARYCFATAVAIRADHVAARIGLATVLHGLKRFDEALACLDDAAKIAPAETHLDVRRGCTLVELGRYEEAAEAFARAQDASPAYPRLVSFERSTWDAIAQSGRSRGAWETALAAPRDAHARGVVLISADTRYARKYGYACLRSLARHAGDALIVHAHVYDPDERIACDLIEVAREAGLTKLAVTTEASRVGADEPARRKSYYACGRFLHLPAWLEHYGLPILSLDVDLIAEAPLATLFDTAERVDVRLSARHSIDSPWLDVVANVVVAFPTPGARDYLETVGNYVLRYLEVERDPWLLDQTALFCVYRMASRFGTPPRIDWMQQAEKLGLWHVGHAYDHRLDDPRFTRYANRPAP